MVEPGEFLLARTLEKVQIPNDLVGFVEGRSSYARFGLTIHITAPKIDPGFKGSITLKIANFGNAKINLRAGEDKPAQLMFFRLSSPLDSSDLYGAGEGDLFYDQDRPTP